MPPEIVFFMETRKGVREAGQGKTRREAKVWVCGFSCSLPAAWGARQPVEARLQAPLWVGEVNTQAFPLEVTRLATRTAL